MKKVILIIALFCSHYLQHLDWGPLFLPLIGAPSLFSTLGIKDDRKHRHLLRWFEVDASKRGANYFNNRYGKHSEYYKSINSSNPNSIDKTQFFNIESFSKGYASDYINPRTGMINQNDSYPISSPVHDSFDYIVPISMLGSFLFFL